MSNVVYVGSSTYVSGNNASVQPLFQGIGEADGDLCVLFASIREDAATINVPSGWTEIHNGTYGGSVVESRLLIATATYGPSISNPIVTFTGGGNNDTTQAIVLIFRNHDPASPVKADTGSGYMADSTSDGNGAVGSVYASGIMDGAGTNYAIGDMVGAVIATTNDGTLTVSTTNIEAYTYSTNTYTPIATTRIVQNNTTLGTDASLAVVFGLASRTWDGQIPRSGMTARLTAPTGHGPGVGMRFYIPQFINNISQIGTGGATIGGAATVETRYSSYEQTGAGGAKVGGAGEYTYSPNSFTATGGIRIGGSAIAELREATTTIVATGGIRIGGEADAYLLSPTVYHIDYFNGSDSNNGLTWVTAFKTFRPIASRVVTPTGGDIIKIAKTPDGATTSTFLASHPLAGAAYNQNSYVNGWRSVYDSLAIPAAMASRIQIVHTMMGPYDTGMFNAGVTVQYDSEVLSTSRATGIRITVNGTTAAGTKLFYVQTPSTLNLSAFGRLEIKSHMHISISGGADTAPANLTLRLCSDTAGNTGIQDITFVPDKHDGCIWAYEGSLPNGVASVAFLTKDLGVSYHLYMRSMIATYPIGHANYLGHFTLWRIGDHEGSFYAPVDSFGRLNSAATLKYHSCVVGASNLYGTNMTIYYRNAISMSRIDWTGLLPLGSNYYVNTGVIYNGQTASDYRILCGHMPSLDLTGLQGVEADPILIECGYDPQTDTVTGITHILNADTGAHYYSGTTGCCTNGMPPIQLDGTAHVKIKNLNMFSYIYGLFGATATENHHLTFENCEFISPQYSVEDQSSSNYYYPLLGATFRIYGNDATDNTNIHDIHFLNCKGTIWPVGTMHRYPAPLAKMRGFTYTNAIFYPYGYRRQQYTENLYGLGKPPPTFTPIEIVGSLKVYCLLGIVSGESNYLVAPTFASGVTATVSYYRGGRLCLSPYVPIGDYTSVYTYPPMQMYDTYPFFFSSYDSLGESYGSLRSGRPSYQIVNSLTITCQSTTWCSDMTSGADSYCLPERIVGIAPYYQIPPIEINNLVLAGAPKPSTNGNAMFANVLGGAIHIRNVTVSTGWTRMMICGTIPGMSSSNTSSDAGSIAILENMTVPASQVFASAPPYSIFGGVVGLLDVRNVSISYTGSYRPNSNVALDGVVRLQDCTITAVASPVFSNFPARYNLGGGLPVPAGFRSSVVVDGGTVALGSTVTATTSYDGMVELTNRNSANELDFRFDIPIVRAVSGTYTIYSHFYILSKDTTIYVSPPFAWKSFLKSIAYNMWSRAYPLGSVPVQNGRTVTFSINLRRSTATNCKARLFVVPHGSAGFNTPSEYLEKVAEHTDGANVWQNVSVSYAVVQDAFVDIYVSHAGAAGTSIWFDDVRVSEI